MSWYGENWPVDQRTWPMEQRTYNREQVADERQMWEQNMEATNHMAFQHFHNFAPYRHNMVNMANMAAVPGFAGVQFPDGRMFTEPPQPSCLLSNEMPTTSTSTKPMPAAEGISNVMPEAMKSIWKEPTPVVQEPQPEIVPDIPVSKIPSISPQATQSKPSTSQPSKGKRTAKKAGASKREKRPKPEKTGKADKPKRKYRKKGAANAPKVDDSNDSPFQCTVCQKFFEFEASLKTHSLLHGGGGLLYKRALLQKSRVEKAKIKNKSSKTYPCTKCGEWFAQSRSLEKHDKAVHS